jgi:hypothetical protein
MACPLCGTRKPRRHCPALGKAICPVCCGTKRRVEVACPGDCPYLAAADAHPPAVVRRQRQRDFEFAATLVHRVPEGAYSLIMALQDVVARYRPSAIPGLRDADVAEACGTLAATLETSAKGIIYEHQAHSLPAQRLAAELRAVVEAARGTLAVERDAAVALRRMETASRTAAAALGGSSTAYLDFIDRLPRELAAASPSGESPATGGAAAPVGGDGPRLILP